MRGTIDVFFDNLLKNEFDQSNKQDSESTNKAQKTETSKLFPMKTKCLIGNLSISFLTGLCFVFGGIAVDRLKVPCEGAAVTVRLCLNRR